MFHVEHQKINRQSAVHAMFHVKHLATALAF